MATQEELMAMGLNARVAKALGQSVQTTVTPTGSTQADAKQIPSATGCVILATASSNTGVILPEATSACIHSIYNNAGNTVIVYAKGTEQINAIAAASGFSLSSAKTAICVPHGQGWHVSMSA